MITKDFSILQVLKLFYKTDILEYSIQYSNVHFHHVTSNDFLSKLYCGRGDVSMLYLNKTSLQEIVYEISRFF